MSLVAKIDEMFNQPEKASQESTQSFVREAIAFVQDLKTRLSSQDEKVREEAIKDAAKIQTELQEQIKKMGAKMQMDPSQVGNYFAAAEAVLPSGKQEMNPNMFAQALSTLQKGLAAQPTKKKPKRVKEWLAS